MNPPAELLAGEPSPGSGDSLPLRHLLRVVGRCCSGCSGRCLAGEVLWSIALGFKDAPRCLLCLGRGLGRDPAELQVQLADYVRRRECYSVAWAEAVRLDGGAPVTAQPAALAAALEREVPVEVAPETAWDAGPLACGELALALRARLSPLPPGAVVRVRATDPAAAEDVPAWCRLTGHALLSASPPEYRIRRKGV